METSSITRSTKSTSVPPCFWSNPEVLQWMKNSLPDLFHKYGGFFKTHAIQELMGLRDPLFDTRSVIGTLLSHRAMLTMDLEGRSLFMLNDNLLLEMGISDSQDRASYRIEIAKLKLKSDLLTLKSSHYKGNIRFVEEKAIDESPESENF